MNMLRRTEEFFLNKTKLFLFQKCLIPQLNLSLQGMTTTGIQRGKQLIYRSAYGVQCMILNFKTQEF